jgi:hypothetical protein
MEHPESTPPVFDPSLSPQGSSSTGASGEVRRTIHRIGGGRLENLRLKPAEEQLKPPGISVLKTDSPQEAAEQIKSAFPGVRQLHDAAKVVGSATEAAIREAGFDVIPNRTRRLPNHHRLIHPTGVTGFGEENLTRLSLVFLDTVVE